MTTKFVVAIDTSSFWIRKTAPQRSYLRVVVFTLPDNNYLIYFTPS